MKGRWLQAFTYVIVAINALFLIWLFAGIWTTSSHPPDWCYMGDEAMYWPSLCANPKIVVAGDIINRWVLGDLILGVVWLHLWVFQRSNDRADLQATSQYTTLAIRSSLH